MGSARDSRNDGLSVGARKSRRKSYQTVRPSIRRRQLWFESLENRRLLAIDVAARFEFVDLTGRPLTSLQAGGDYALRMYISDVRSAASGIKQAYFDVSYPTSLITVNGSIDHGSAFSSAPFGDLTTLGLIDEVGGRDPDIPPPIPSTEQLLFSVPFHANGSGTLAITATTASRFSFFFDTVVAMQADSIAYSGGTIEIVSAGIVVTPTTLQTTENGGNASFTAVLQSQPTANVSFSVSSSNTSEGVVSTSNLIFTPANWNIPQTVIVTGVDDAVVDGNVSFSVITGAVTSSDARYSGFNPSDVSLTNLDNDVATLSIVAPNIVESSVDQTVNFTVTLNKAVSGGFTVGFASANGTATGSNDFVLASLSPIAFTGIVGETKNISVTIKGDQIVESNETFTITLGAVTAADPVVAGNITTGASAVGIIANDDTATVSIAPPIITESDNSQTVEFRVTVDKPVAGGFSIAFSGSNGTAGASDYLINTTSPLTFLGVAGEVKTITVTVFGDKDVEANETFSISLGAVTPVAPVQASSILTGASATATIVNDDTALAITAVDSSKAERNSGSTAFTFNVIRSGVTTGTSSVSYAVTGTGLSPADATDFGVSFPAGVITFAANETSKSIAINVQGDTTIESDEGFNVTLSNAVGANSITTASAAGTILNDDNSLAISAVSASKLEGDSGLTDFTFKVVRTGQVSGTTTTVNYAVTGNGANPVDGADFEGVLPTGVITFNPGDTEQTLTIRVNGDISVESDEGFLVSLSNATGGALITGSSATGQILNDDSSISLTATDANKLEGNTGSTPFVFTVTRSGLTNSAATLNFNVIGDGANPANAADFGGTLPAGQVSFASNETTKTITLNVIGDLLVESDEGFVLRLSNSAGRLLGTAAGTIRNDDSVISIVAVDGTKLEGDSGLTPFRFTINRTGVVAGAASVNYTVTGSSGNPADAADFGGQLPSGTINFAANETSKTITINVQGDTAIEADEQFTVTLSGAPSGTQIAPASAVSTIQSDEVALSISAVDSSKPEGDSGTTPFTFLITRTGGVLGTDSVNYSVAGAGANPANASDFGSAFPSGTVTFSPGESTKTLTIPVTGDALVEPTESFSVTLSNASGQAQITTVVAQGTIANDDSSLSIAVESSSLPEGNAGTTTFSFTITRSGNSAAAATVNYALTGAGISPADAADFAGSLPSGQIAFAANETSKTLAINVSSDTAVEADERFVVTLSGASGNTTIATASASATITNDDSSTLTISNVSQSETTSSAAAVFQFEVRLSNAVSGGLSLPFSVTGDTATLSDDFTLGSSSPLQFSGTAGETKTISVQVVADAVVEADEVFRVVLGAITGLSSGIAPSAITVLNATATGTILNDDNATLSVTSVSKIEGNSGVSQYAFDVTLSSAVASGFDLAYSVASATTDVASDLGAIPTQPLRFAGSANETHSISIPVLGDAIVEADETFQLILGAISNLANGILPGQFTRSGSPATGTIQNDDTATISISDASGLEGSLGQSQLSFGITLSQAVDVPVLVRYSTLDGSAQTSGSDYVATSGTLTFLPGGSLSQSISVPVIGDNIVEQNETFRLVLNSIDLGSTARNVTLARAEATGTILADDGSLLSISDTRLSEGDDGTQQLTFEVSVSKPDTDSFTVDFATEDGTATSASGDYVLKQGTLTFTPSGPTTQTVAITINGDRTVEGDETIQLRLSNLVSTSSQVLLDRSVASGTIDNNDAATISVEDAQATEGNSGLKELALNVSLSSPVDVPVTISYTTTNDTAISAEDYQTATGTITFNPGEVRKSVLVSIVGDALVESSERFNLQLSNLTVSPPRAVTIAKGTAVGTITNDDFAVVTISAERQATEDSVSGELRIVTNSRFQTAVELSLEVSGTASNGTDYTSISNSIVFPANADSITIPITTIDDSLIEGNENVTIRLVSIGSTEGQIGSQNIATVVITDNDTASLSIESTKSVSEGAGASTIVVTLSTSNGKGGFATLAEGVTLSAAVVDVGGGTATSSADYTALVSQAVTFLTGAGNGATSTIAFTPLQDTLVEGQESVRLRLQNLNTTLDGRVSTINTDSVVTIIDNDTASLVIQSTAEASEQSGPQTIVVTLRTSDGSGGTATLAPGVSLTANVADTSGGTATSGSDYTNFGTQQVSFAAGATDGTTATISISAINDSLVEGTETVQLRLQDLNSTLGTQATLGNATYTLSVVDNDTARLSIAPVSLLESGGSQSVTVQLITSDGNGGTASLGPGVSLSTEIVEGQAGTAGSGVDYVAIGTKSVSFSAGAANGATATFSLEMINDKLVEGAETFSLRLQNLVSSAASQATLDASPVSVTIQDNDTASISIERSKTLFQQNGSQSVLVTLNTSDGAGSAATLGPGITLSVQIVDAGVGSAQSGVDYQAFSTQVVTFAAGETNNATKSILVTPLERDGDQAERTLTLRLEKSEPSELFAFGNTESLITISNAPATSELHGLVYVDANGNGVYDANRESGLPGVTLTLSGTDVVGSPVQLTVMSAENGSYGFTGLRAGTYKITKTQPAAFLSGKISTNLAGVSIQGNSLTNLRLEANAIVNDINFGELGVRARYINARTFVVSTLKTIGQLRTVVAQAEQVIGNALQATQIRLKNVLSVATANIPSVPTVAPSSASTVASVTTAGAPSANTSINPGNALQAEGEGAELAAPAITSSGYLATSVRASFNTELEVRKDVAPLESPRPIHEASADYFFSSSDIVDVFVDVAGRDELDLDLDKLPRSLRLARK